MAKNNVSSILIVDDHEVVRNGIRSYLETIKSFEVVGEAESGEAAVKLVARIMRSQLLEVNGQDYVRTATAKGLRRRTVVWRHAVRNALIPVVTFIGIDLGVMMGGAILTETIFNWPGVG